MNNHMNCDGVDTHNKDLTVACDDTQELAYNSCDYCEALATVILDLNNGTSIYVCEICDINLRESIAELEDQIENRLEHVEFWNEDDYSHTLCEGCEQCPATREFLHLDGRHFLLCTSCYIDADHDDDYMQPEPSTPLPALQEDSPCRLERS